MHRSVPGQQQQQAPYSRDLGSGPRRFGRDGGGGGGARRWLGSRSGGRLHPVLLIPVFLCGAFLAPWLGLASTSTDSRLPEPVYHPPERDWTLQKVLAPADAPPLRRDDDEYAAAYAAPPPPPPPKRAQARDWQTYDGDDGGNGDDGDDSFLVHTGLLYFRTSPALIPEHRLERPIPIAPARPRNNYQQAPPIPDSAAGAAGWTEPPPAPRDWLVPGELFAHPPGRRKHLTPPSDPNPNLAAAKPPKPVVIPRQRAPAVPPARQPPPPPQPQRDEHNGHVLGPNAAAMARAKREGRPFVPGTPAELLEKVKAHRQRIQDEINAERRKAEEPLIRQRQQELLLRQEAEADRRRKQQQQQQAAMRPGLGLRKIDTDGKAPPPPPPVGEANLLWGDDDEQDELDRDDDQHGSSAVEDDLALLAAIRALTPAELRDLSPDERQLVAELEEASQQQHRDSDGRAREGGGGRGAAAGAPGGAGAGAGAGADAAQRRGAWNVRAGARGVGGGPPAAPVQWREQKEEEKGAGAGKGGAGGGAGGGERQKQMAALRGGRPLQRREKRALQEEEEEEGAEGEQQQQESTGAVNFVDDDSAKTAAVEEEEKASVAAIEEEPDKVDGAGDHQDQGRSSLTRRASIPIAASSETADRLHPITHLIAEAEQEWENMLRRQSQSLEQAVREYKRRYKMNPPAGFDSWWRYAMQNRIVLVDEYDQIYDDILPFLSLPPSEFRRRVTHLKADASLPWRDSSFSFSIRDGHVQTPGAGESTGGKDDLLDIIGEIASMLPDLEIRMNKGDEPTVVVSGEAKKRHNDLAERHKLLPPAALYDVAEPTGFSPWDSLCPSNSTARRVTQGLPVDMPAKSPFLRSFVATQQHSVANDLCEHPEIRDLNGFTSWAGPRPYLLYPLFSPMKTSVHSDLLFPSITNDYYTEIGRDPLWEQKKYNQVLWRGETTGAYHAKGTGWRQTQRARLVQLANEQTGQTKLHLADASASDSLRLLHAPSKDVLPLYFDVAYSGAPIQCSSKDATCQQLQRDYRFDRALLADQENQYKYVLDVDANYASGKFKRLMSSRSLVFKSSIFIEWWSKRIMPWYHYIPIQSDYSDLVDVAAYFIGAPDGSGSHDKVAKRIAQQGKKWSDEHWREVDMKAYLFRLLLEYARLLNRDAKDVHSMDFL